MPDVRRAAAKSAPPQGRPAPPIDPVAGLREQRHSGGVDIHVAGCAAGAVATLDQRVRIMNPIDDIPPVPDAAMVPGAPHGPFQSERPDVTLRVNGEDRRLSLDPRRTLLDVLRDDLGLTGAKRGCDHGACGACTVLVDGRPLYACLTLAVMQDGREITTIEGLGDAETLDAMQRAFIDHDALQCGFCTPGQVLTAITCVEAGAAADDAETRAYMSGTLCRCGAYANIVAAIAAVDRGDYL